MITIRQIRIDGTCDLGEFAGKIELGHGAELVVARNGFGKSLIASAIAWCLGLEPMFGLTANDASMFPEAVRGTITLDTERDVAVRTSAATVEFERHDRARLRITRPIVGAPADSVLYEELNEHGSVTRSGRLFARKEVMASDTSGLQRKLFDWAGLPVRMWPRHQGGEYPIYLENIAPLFFIEQTEGWSDIQCLQVMRYGFVEIAQASVEYLLGADVALDVRHARQTRALRESQAKEDAIAIAARISETLREAGWSYSPSVVGTPAAIAKRWKRNRLLDEVSRLFNFDYVSEQTRLRARLNELQKQLLDDNRKQSDMGASAELSSRVIELKRLRHERSEQIRTLRIQLKEHKDLYQSLLTRKQSAKDLQRLKVAGVGLLDHAECPACHRSIDPSEYALTEHTREELEAYIASVEREIHTVDKNISRIDAELAQLHAALTGIDEELRSVSTSLELVNRATSLSRENLIKLVGEVRVTEREMERNEHIHARLSELQTEVDRWIGKNDTAASEEGGDAVRASLERRRAEFVGAFRRYLVALGHDAVENVTLAKDVDLDEDYIPYFGTRRLRSLGSASDRARLITAYVLALLYAALECGGHHPGFVVLDEPQQQNPDKERHDKFVKFAKEIATWKRGQVLIFTYITPSEAERLRKSGVRVRSLEGKHFLKMVSPRSS